VVCAHYAYGDIAQLTRPPSTADNSTDAVKPTEKEVMDEEADGAWDVVDEAEIKEDWRNGVRLLTGGVQ